MPLEVELKFRVGDFLALSDSLVRLGAELVGETEQADVYLNHPCKDLAESGEAFRIRREGAKAVLCYKGPRQTGSAKIREELEVPFESDDFDSLLPILQRLGFQHVATVNKNRVNWKLNLHSKSGTTALAVISLDNVQHLGLFAEIELLVDSENSGEAADQVNAVAVNLGLTDIESRSYLTMLLAEPEC